VGGERRTHGLEAAAADLALYELGLSLCLFEDVCAALYVPLCNGLLDDVCQVVVVVAFRACTPFCIGALGLVRAGCEGGEDVDIVPGVFCDRARDIRVAVRPVELVVAHPGGKQQKEEESRGNSVHVINATLGRASAGPGDPDLFSVSTSPLATRPPRLLWDPTHSHRQR
jgi:hypothetical protein